eukprot:1151243-Pelagomonas_calceolata.AAC.2
MQVSSGPVAERLKERYELQIKSAEAQVGPGARAQKHRNYFCMRYVLQTQKSEVQARYELQIKGAGAQVGAGARVHDGVRARMNERALPRLLQETSAVI